MNVYAAIVNDHRGRLLQTVTRLVFFVVVSSLFSYICFLILRAQELMADIGELLYFSLVFFSQLFMVYVTLPVSIILPVSV